MSLERLRDIAARAAARQRGSVSVPTAVLDRALRSIAWLERRHEEHRAELEEAQRRNSELQRTLEAERAAFARAVVKLEEGDDDG